MTDSIDTAVELAPDTAGVPDVAAPSAPTVSTPGIQGSSVDDRSIRSLELLHGVELSVTVELGRARMTMRDLLGLRAGRIVELDRNAGSPVDVMVNGTLLARGEVVVVDDELGVRITEIVANGAEGEA